MTSAEYRAAIKTLGLSLSEAGPWLGVASVTSRRWATSDSPPPPVAKLLRLMLAMRLTPAYVDEVVMRGSVINFEAGPITPNGGTIVVSV